MDRLLTPILTGFTAFSATNLDDIVILLLFFSQVNATFRRKHIIIGQYVGFAALVVASLPGFFGGMILPQHSIGLLGLVPIAFGINRLFNREDDSSEEAGTEIEESEASPLASFLSPQTYSVAAVTVANGSDNIGVYVPLFASNPLENLLVILGVFFTLLGVWCYAAYKLAYQPAIAHVLTRYGNHFVPFVLISLGVFIILESQALSPLALVGSSLCLVALAILDGKATEVEEN